MKIGLFFGSFNPVHVGHLVIAQAVLNETELDKVWMVVSPQNPFKTQASLLPEADRLQMLERALQGNPDISASDVEFTLPRPSYTIDTLLHLHSLHAEHEFAIVMGEDNLDHFDKWKRYEELLDGYTIYCYPRLSSAGGFFEKYPAVRRFEMPYLDLSATRIREMCAAGKSVRYMVPHGAFEYLQEKRFYGA